MSLITSSLLLNAQYTAIPDTNFENALCAYDDIPDDGQVPTANIVNVTSLNVSHKDIWDLTGIEDFVALEYLDCSDNNISYLNLNNNINLIELDCSINYMIGYDKLILNTCSLLTYLNCGNTGINNLDLQNNTALEYLLLGMLYEDEGYPENSFINLDLSNNPNLLYVDGDGSEFYIKNINLKNGNNEILLFHVCDYLIECIQVDDAEAANNGEGVYADWGCPYSDYSYSEDCYDNLGLYEGVYDNLVSIIPNPVNNIFSIEIPNAMLKEVRIYNNLGQLIKIASSDVVDISNIPTGIYYVIIYDTYGQKTLKKVIKLQ